MIQLLKKKEHTFNIFVGEANEMALEEGEVITQIDQVDEGWWFGVSEDGKKEGLFPGKILVLPKHKQTNNSI
jgi:hypothetical protein